MGGGGADTQRSPSRTAYAWRSASSTSSRRKSGQWCTKLSYSPPSLHILRVQRSAANKRLSHMSLIERSRKCRRTRRRCRKNLLRDNCLALSVDHLLQDLRLTLSPTFEIRELFETGSRLEIFHTRSLIIK